MHDFADLERVAVEDAHDIEAAGPEVPVIEDGAAKIANAHKRHAPFPVNAKGAGNGRNEGGYIVAHAAHAKFAKIGQILAHLGAVYPAGHGKGIR